MSTALVLLFALGLDAIFGEPKWLWSRLPHPAVLMGRAIAAADQHFNSANAKRAKGVALTIALVCAAAVIGSLLSRIPGLDILLGAILLAHKSLIDHVRAVAGALGQSLDAGRNSVGMIVGRDTADMTEEAVARAAIESAAENFSDGLVAPAFWFLIAGLPGIFIYKAINTADSMIGYMTDKHREFGWAAARLDDLLNLIPARLTAALLFPWITARNSLTDAIGEARQHRSPNAGWPEAALARSLGLALSGPRQYHGTMRDYPWVNPAGRRDAHAADITRACAQLWRAWIILCLAIALLAIFAA